MKRSKTLEILEEMSRLQDHRDEAYEIVRALADGTIGFDELQARAEKWTTVSI